MKIKVEFCEFWFKSKDGKTFYKVHFRLDADRTAYVPSDRVYAAGDEIMLAVGRDKDGRAKVQIRH